MALVTFAMVSDAAWPGLHQLPWRTAPAAGPVGRLVRPSAPDPWGVGSFLSLVRPTCAHVCGVLGHLAPVHRCARLVRSFACAVSWATWLLFTGVPARCVVLCMCGVLGHLAPVHRCARSVWCFACAVSLATWLLFTGVPAWFVVLRVRCPGPLGPCSPVCPLGVLPVCAGPGPLGSCSPVCPLGALFCLCGVLGQLATVHRCACLVRCFACAVSCATWLLFTSLSAWCVVLLERSPGPFGSCSPVCPLGVLCCVCAVSWATWLLFTGVPARCVALRVRCPGPLGSCSPACPLGALLCVCGVLGHLAPVDRCAPSVRCFACAEPWATWLLFTAVPAWFVVLRVRCHRPLGSCSPLCPRRLLCRVCGVLGHLAPVHRRARSVRCSACAVSWATWLLFTGVPVWFVVLSVRCPGPLGSCSPVCPLDVLFCLRGVLGHLAPVHRCAHPVRCFACAVSSATWLLFTGVPAWCVVLPVRSPGPLGSFSPVCWLGVLFCLCGFLGHLAPLHRSAYSVRCFACAVSWAPWRLFTGALARCAVRCPGPFGSCSPVCSPGVLCCWLCVPGVAAGRSLVHPDGGYS